MVMAAMVVMVTTILIIVISSCCYKLLLSSSYRYHFVIAVNLLPAITIYVQTERKIESLLFSVEGPPQSLRTPATHLATCGHRTVNPKPYVNPEPWLIVWIGLQFQGLGLMGFRVYGFQLYKLN